VIVAWRGKKPHIGNNVFIAPNAVVVGDVTIGDGSSIWYGAVLRGDFGSIQIGAGANVQDNAVIHTSAEQPTIIGDEATIGHGVVMEACTIGRGAVIGINAVVLNGAEVGDDAMIAAGSVVTERMQIPAAHLAAGAPAVVKKELSGSSLEWISKAAPEYQDLAVIYREELLSDPHPY
jgi:carbonic anhydrase/acetyltransferase-like protein (isoleucine patch superfamily)